MCRRGGVTAHTPALLALARHAAGFPAHLGPAAEPLGAPWDPRPLWPSAEVAGAVLRPPSIPPTLLRPATPRCGHRLGSFDAVVAGDVYASRPKIFEIMARLAQENMYSATTAPRPGACGSYA